MAPRPGWQETVARQGLVFDKTVNEVTGTISHYWNESACYELTVGEVNLLEGVSENLHRMSKDAAAFLAEESLKPDSVFNLGIPREAIEYAAESLRRGDPSFYSNPVATSGTAATRNSSRSGSASTTTSVASTVCARTCTTSGTPTPTTPVRTS